MRFLHISPLTKEHGLREIQRIGWVLVDVTYEPVDKLSNTARDQAIIRDYSLLLRDLTRVDKSVPVLLIKENEPVLHSHLDVLRGLFLQPSVGCSRVYRTIL